jgi:ABC-type uncharacterized transport system permease subunit
MAGYGGVHRLQESAAKRLHLPVVSQKGIPVTYMLFDIPVMVITNDDVAWNVAAYEEWRLSERYAVWLL